MKKMLAAAAALCFAAVSFTAYAAGNPATGDESGSPVALYVVIVAAAIIIAALLILPYLQKDKSGKDGGSPPDDTPSSGPEEPKR